MNKVRNPFEYIDQIGNRELTPEEKQDALWEFNSLCDDLVLAHMNEVQLNALLFGGREVMVETSLDVGDSEYLEVRLIQSEVPEGLRIPTHQIDIYAMKLDGRLYNGVSYRSGPDLPVYRHDDTGMDFDLPRRPLGEEVDDERYAAELACAITLNDQPVGAEEVQKVRALLLRE